MRAYSHWLAVLAVAGLLVAACGDLVDGTETPTAEREPSGTPAVAAPSPPTEASDTPVPETPTVEVEATEAAPSETPAEVIPRPESPPVPSERRADELSLPQGFAAFVVAEGLSRPTTVTVDERGRLWVTESDRALVLSDGDGDGFFEETTVYADGFSELNGFAFSPQGDAYLSHTGRVSRTVDADGDDVADEVVDVISGLPNGRHQNNGITFGPGGKLYVTNGSTCNDCVEEDERSATVLQANADGSELRVYARGLRNPYSLVFDPEGRLWAGDNGSDPPCNTIDELNLIVDGGDYGWPYGPECDSFAKGTAPVADLGFNTASTGLVYYDSDGFPAQYRGNIFITLWGSLGFAPAPGGRYLARVVLTETSGMPAGEAEGLVTGLDRPVDVEVVRDGSLLLLDHGAGRVYRIVYEG